MAIKDFTLTIWQTGVSYSAQIECPSFVDSEGDFIDVQDALRWASERIAHIDPFEVDADG